MMYSEGCNGFLSEPSVSFSLPSQNGGNPSSEWERREAAALYRHYRHSAVVQVQHVHLKHACSVLFTLSVVGEMPLNMQHYRNVRIYMHCHNYFGFLQGKYKPKDSILVRSMQSKEK